jgi:hypothetical protein
MSKQHTLSPAKVRKVCYSLAGLCQNCLFQVINVKGVAMLMEHLWGGGAQGIKVWEPPPFRPNYTDLKLSYDSRGLSEGAAVQVLHAPQKFDRPTFWNG